MNSEEAWALVSSGIQVQPQVILDPDYLSDFFPFLMTMTTGIKKYKSIIKNKRKKSMIK